MDERTEDGAARPDQWSTASEHGTATQAGRDAIVGSDVTHTPIDNNVHAAVIGGNNVQTGNLRNSTIAGRDINSRRSLKIGLGGLAALLLIGSGAYIGRQTIGGDSPDISQTQIKNSAGGPFDKLNKVSKDINLSTVYSYEYTGRTIGIIPPHLSAVPAEEITPPDFTQQTHGRIEVTFSAATERPICDLMAPPGTFNATLQIELFNTSPENSPQDSAIQVTPIGGESLRKLVGPREQNSNCHDNYGFDKLPGRGQVSSVTAYLIGIPKDSQRYGINVEIKQILVFHTLNVPVEGARAQFTYKGVVKEGPDSVEFDLTIEPSR